MAKRKTQERNPVVAEVPAACPRCGSFKREVLRSDTRPLGTMMIDGAVHTGIVLRRCTCLDCGRRYITKSPVQRENEPPNRPGQGKLLPGSNIS